MSDAPAGPYRPPAPPGLPPGGARWGTRHVVLVGVVALIVGLGAGAAVGKADDDPDRVSATATTGTSAGERSTITERLTTTTERQTTTTQAAGGTRSRPLPVGEAAEVGDGWRVKVLGSTRDAGQQILAENQFNEPPLAGEQFFIANVQVMYDGAEQTATPSALAFQAVGSSNVAFTTFGDSCGVIPAELPSTELFQGGTATGNICWAVPSADAAALLMTVEAAFAFDGDKVFFAL